MTSPTCLALAKIHFDRGFLAGRARLVRNVVIPYQWEALNDRIPGAERSGTVNNFQIAAGEKTGKFYGFWFQDSDLAKWIGDAGLADFPPLVKLFDRVNKLIADDSIGGGEGGGGGPKKIETLADLGRALRSGE